MSFPRRSHIAALCAVGALLLAIGIGVAIRLTRSDGKASAAAECDPQHLGLAGCGQSPAAEISRTWVPADMADADELYKYLAAANLFCGPLDHVANPSWADTMIDCGPQIVLATYSSHKLAENQYAVLTSSGMPVHIAIGGNWTVSGSDEQYVRKAAAALGGEYRTSR